MKFTILTLFPEIIQAYFAESIMKRAVEKNCIEFSVHNIRDYSTLPHKRCDDEPYGGGYGMLLSPEPLACALDACGGSAFDENSTGVCDSHKLYEQHSPCVDPKKSVPYTIFPTPGAKLYTQADAERLAKKQELIFICGRYEGIDQRIIDMYVDETFSIGEYVLSSGEIATLTMIDSIYRHVDGVIRKESLREESYNHSNNGRSEYPQYTRPAEFRGRQVPEVLLSGNHKAIEEWRALQSKLKTECAIFDRNSQT